MSDSAPRAKIDDLLAHRRWVRALALRLAADSNAADDIEQDTWLAALKSPPKHAGSPRGWLGAVVWNFARLSARRGARRERHELAVAPRACVPAPEEVVAAAEAHSSLARAVLDLDEPYRSTVLYRYFEGLEATEVAERLGVPVETVRTRLKRGIAHLRARLGPRRDDRQSWAPLLSGPSGGSVEPPPARRVARPFAGALVAATLLLTTAVVALFESAWFGPRPVDVAARDVDRDASSGRTIIESSRPRRAARASNAAMATPVVDADVVAFASAKPESDAAAVARRFKVTAVTTAGTPVAGIPVGVESSGRPLLCGTTDADGAWTCDRAPVEARVYANVENAVVGRWFLESQTTAGPQDAEARLVLVEAGLVRGRVVGPDDQPLPMLELDAQIDGEPVFRSNSDEAGRFVVRAPLRRVADVVLTGQLYQRSYGNGYAIQRAVSSPWEGVLRGAAAGAEDVVLRAAPAARDAEIDVVAVDPNGVPVVGAAVLAGRNGDYAAIFLAGQRLTNSAGRIHLTGLDRRAIRVGASIPDFAERPFDWLPPVEQDVVAHGQEVRLAFRPAAVLTGVVVFPSGRPAAAFHVRLRVEAAGDVGPTVADATTDAQGAFRLLFPPETRGPFRIDARTEAGPAADSGGAKTVFVGVVTGVAPGASGVRVALVEK